MCVCVCVCIFILGCVLWEFCNEKLNEIVSGTVGDRKNHTAQEVKTHIATYSKIWIIAADVDKKADCFNLK